MASEGIGKERRERIRKAAKVCKGSSQAADDLLYVLDALAAAEKRAVDAEADTRKLDWVLNNYAVLLDGCIFTENKPWKSREPDFIYQGDIPKGGLPEYRRAAIDAAMKPQEGTAE